VPVTVGVPNITDINKSATLVFPSFVRLNYCGATKLYFTNIYPPVGRKRKRKGVGSPEMAEAKLGKNMP
jgi:hypothetical protein